MAMGVENSIFRSSAEKHRRQRERCEKRLNRLALLWTEFWQHAETLRVTG